VYQYFSEFTPRGSHTHSHTSVFCGAVLRGPARFDHHHTLG
jgi:hypothetical protein